MTSRLVIGTPRIPAKPPRRYPCSEPYILGPNIHHDPGFENILSLGGGPLGDEFPFDSASTTNPVWSDSSPAPWGGGWYQAAGGAGDSRWKIASTGTPDAGTYHAKWDAGTATTVSRESYKLIPTRFLICGFTDNGHAAAMSCRVEPGDVVSVTIRAKATFTTTAPLLRFSHYFARYQSGLPAVDGSYPTAYTADSHTLTTSYATYTADPFVAPDGAYYYFVRILARKETTGGAETAVVYLDTYEISVE